MSAIKARIQEGIDHIEKGMAAISAVVVDDANAVGQERDELLATLRSYGRRLAKDSRLAGKEASRDVRAHPYVYSGVAFALATGALAVVWQKMLRH